MIYDFLPGNQNTMADDVSRLHQLTHTEFLSCFNSLYQDRPWHLWIPSRPIVSAVTSALTSAPASFLHDLAPSMPIGNSVRISAPSSASILPFMNAKTPSHSFKSLFDDTALEQLHPAVNQVRYGTVEDELRSVGQAFTSVGAPDPRLTDQGNIDGLDRSGDPHFCPGGCSYSSRLAFKTAWCPGQHQPCHVPIMPVGNLCSPPM
jgi:hypothetical protein